jgi:predicted glycoside hydrolase/deacetylase ChbG (UPF0249 family)
MNKEKKRNTIMVSADDFGMDDESDRIILTVLKAGKIDRLAVFVNRNRLSVDVIESFRNSGVKVDIHLDLPNGNGIKKTNIHRLWHFFINFISGKNSRRKVENAWIEQIEKFREVFGHYPDGINSHEHVHLFPFYFSIVSEIAEKYKIPFVRIGRKSFFSSNGVSVILELVKMISFHRHKKMNTCTSDYMISLDWICDICCLSEVKKLPGTIELVTHPANKEESEIIMKYL